MKAFNKKSHLTFPPEGGVKTPKGEGSRISVALRELDDIHKNFVSEKIDMFSDNKKTTIDETKVAKIVENITDRIILNFWYPEVPDEDLIKSQEEFDALTIRKDGSRKYNVGTEPRNNDTETLKEVVMNQVIVFYLAYPGFFYKEIPNIGIKIIEKFIEKITTKEQAMIKDVDVSWPEVNTSELTNHVVSNLPRELNNLIDIFREGIEGGIETSKYQTSIVSAASTKEKTTEQKNVDTLAAINGGRRYADEQIDFIIELTGENIAGVEFIKTATARSPEMFSQALIEFAASDNQQAIIPVHVAGDHFTALHIMRNGEGYKITYIDPLGKNLDKETTKIHAIPQHIVDGIREAYHIGKKQIIRTSTILQSYKTEPDFEIENIHCGGYSTFLLNQIVEGNIRINNNDRLEIETGQNVWQEIPNLNTQQSNDLGYAIRNNHSELLTGAQITVNPLDTLRSMVVGQDAGASVIAMDTSTTTTSKTSHVEKIEQARKAAEKAKKKGTSSMEIG